MARADKFFLESLNRFVGYDEIEDGRSIADRAAIFRIAFSLDILIRLMERYITVSASRK